MLSIKKGHPWIFWPSSICDTLPINPGNKLLSGDKYFKLTLEYILRDSSDDQKTLFTIVPRFTGLDLYKNKSVLTVTCEDNAEYIDLDYIAIENERTKLVIEHSSEVFFNLFINDSLIHNLDLKGRSFGIADSPHLILGAGNFPKNDFNLNYLDVDFLEFKLEDETQVVSHHRFEEFIFDKSVDSTDNCNFIHKL
jgi:hypothetical protein